MSIKVSEDTAKNLKSFLKKEKKDKEEKEKRDTETQTIINMREGFISDFDLTLEENLERFKEYYLEKIKCLVENKKEYLVSKKIIKDAIKNGLTIKYPELKDLLN